MLQYPIVHVCLNKFVLENQFSVFDRLMPVRPSNGVDYDFVELQ